MLKRLFASRSDNHDFGASAAKKEPHVFLLAPTQRSGTNYLFNMLVETGLCRRPESNVAAGEDFFLHYSHLLMKYIDEVGQRRSKMDFLSAEEAQAAQDQLLNSIGRTLNSLVGKANGVPIVTKTPSTRNVANVFSVFPDARLILLCRDGRDTCNSLYRSGMAKSWKSAFANWADRANEAVEFAGSPDRPNTTNGPIKWVRYEDAVRDPRAICLEMAEFLELDATKINWNGLSNLKVYGSSEAGGSRDSWTYKTERMDKSFNPIGRWHNWNTSRVALFKKLANQQLLDLGYETDPRWSAKRSLHAES